MTDFFFEESDQLDTLPQSYATGPKTGFMENFRASYQAMLSAGRTDSRELSLASAYEPVVDALNRDFRKAEGFTLVSPDRDRMFANPYRGRSPNPALDAADGVPYQEQRIWDEINRRRTRDPKFLEHLGRDRSEFIARSNAAARDDLLDEAETGETSTGMGVLGGFAGAMAGGATDPINMASMLFGLGPSRSILSTALREAGLNAAAETASLPMTAERRAELGFDTTLGDAAFQVSVAAGAGFVLGGAIEGLTRGAQRLSGGRPINPDKLSDAELLGMIDARAPNLSDDLADARAVLAEKVEIDRLNPFDSTPEGHQRHYDALDEATVRLLDDGALPAEKPAISERPEDRFAAFDELGGEGQRRQAKTIMHDLRAEATPDELDRFAVALEETIVDGQPAPVMRPLREVIDELDADDAFLRAAEACLV